MKERAVRATIAAVCKKLDRTARRLSPAALVPLVAGMQLIDAGCASVYGESGGGCEYAPALQVSVGAHFFNAWVTVAGPCQALECSKPDIKDCTWCRAWFLGDPGDSCEVTLHLHDGTTCVVERVFHDVGDYCPNLQADPIDFDCEHDSLCPTGGPFGD